ncbi:MAG: molybdenum ABC transporter ATP-binding protein [Alphaproteobacteria bacterium]
MLEMDVKARRGAFVLDARLTAAAGGVTAVFGPSGSGKTTLVNMIAGLVRPDSGRILLDDTVLFDSEQRIDLPTEQRGLGYVFQDGRLFPHLSVRGNLTFGMRRARGPGPEMDRVIGILGIGHLLDRRPAKLSGGERQRVAMGRALLAGPRLLLMDEPLASIDAARKNEVLPLIEQMRDEFSLPILFVSHAMEEIVRLADKMVLIEEGRVRAAGPLTELLSRLDLLDATGRDEAGAALEVAVAGHESRDRLTRLAFPGGELLVPLLALPVGERLRVRVHARDVALALEPPAGLSILNAFPGTVMEMAESNRATVDLRLDIGVPLLSRITARSARTLGIAPGKKVHALIKSVAVDRRLAGGDEKAQAGSGV